MDRSTERSTKLTPPLLSTPHNQRLTTLLDRLERDAPAIARRMAEAVRREVPEYGAVRDPAFAAELLAHAEEHVHAFVRACRSGDPPRGSELEFVRERGERRAAELLPLDSLLHSYLVGQRTVWEAIVETSGSSPEGMRAAQVLTGATFGYTHAINLAVAAAYLRIRQHKTAETDRVRRDLLEALLSGREDVARERARQAETLGLEPGLRHAVVVAVVQGSSRAAGATEPLRFTAEAVACHVAGGGAFVVPRHEELVAIVPLAGPGGAAQLRAELEAVGAQVGRAHGVTLHAGLSTPCQGLVEVARGYREAHRALRHAGAGRPVIALAEVGLFDALVGGADKVTRQLVPEAVRRLVERDARQQRVLLSTLLVYAEADLSIARAAERLVVHPNTVHYRLRRIAEATGRDPRRFGDLVELLAAVRLLEADDGPAAASGTAPAGRPLSHGSPELLRSARSRG